MVVLYSVRGRAQGLPKMRIFNTISEASAQTRTWTTLSNQVTLRIRS